MNFDQLIQRVSGQWKARLLEKNDHWVLTQEPAHGKPDATVVSYDDKGVILYYAKPFGNEAFEMQHLFIPWSKLVIVDRIGYGDKDKNPLSTFQH